MIYLFTRTNVQFFYYVAYKGVAPRSVNMSTLTQQQSDQMQSTCACRAALFFLSLTVFITVNTINPAVTTPSRLFLFQLLGHGLSSHQVVATPSAEIPIAQSAQHFKEICDRVGSPNVIRGGGRNSAKPTDDAAEGRPLAQRSRLGSTNPDAVGQRNTSGRRGPRVSNASAQQQQRPFNRKRLRGDNAQRVFGHEAVARNGAAGPRKSLVPKKRPSGHTRRGFVSGHSGPKVKGGVAGVAAEAAKAPPVSSGRVNSRKERAEDGGVGSGDEMCDADRSSAESADPRDGVGISCIDSVNADDTERTGGASGLGPNILIR